MSPIDKVIFLASVVPWVAYPFRLGLAWVDGDVAVGSALDFGWHRRMLPARVVSFAEIGRPQNVLFTISTALPLNSENASRR